MNPATESNSDLPTLVVRPGESGRLLAGHPWLYDNSILRFSQPVADGELVQVKDHRQRLVGVGFYNSRSKIAVRILAPDRVEVNEAFFEQRIRTALAVRQRHLPGATSFRAVHAESDFLSGLIVDQYEDVLVVQISSLGMDQHKPQILAALKSVFSPRAIIERSDIATRKFEGLSEQHRLLAGELEGELWVELNGLKFGVDLLGGHKTGLYLDQQVNYAAVAKLVAPGAQVLDCFTFLGGFALHAARAGAGGVLGLDQSKEAVAAAAKNAAANGMADQCVFETANVFDWLKAQSASLHEKLTPKFDLIVLDPPAFTRSRETLPSALRGYKEIHIRALKLLKPGGTLATFTCSHRVDAKTFEEVILSAAFDTHKILRRVAAYSQSPDHPVIPAIPETEYLKGYSFELVQ